MTVEKGGYANQTRWVGAANVKPARWKPRDEQTCVCGSRANVATSCPQDDCVSGACGTLPNVHATHMKLYTPPRKSLLVCERFSWATACSSCCMVVVVLDGRGKVLVEMVFI